MNKVYLIAIPVVVLTLAAGIIAGVLYQKNQGGNKGQYQNFQRGQMMNGAQNTGARLGNTGLNGQDAFARPVSGEVVAVDDKSLTVKLTDGSTKIVILSDTTKYTKSQDVTKAEVKVGDKVAVISAQGQSTTVVAETVELNPTLRGQNR